MNVMFTCSLILTDSFAKPCFYPHFVFRSFPASVWVCGHWSPADLHPPPAPQLSQEVAAPHEDDVSYQPECGHAPPSPRHRHENTGKTSGQGDDDDSKLVYHSVTPKALYFPSEVSSCKHFKVAFPFFSLQTSLFFLLSGIPLPQDGA